MKTFLVILGVAAGFFLSGCNKGKDVAGSTETGNTSALVSGHLYNIANGHPAKGAKVRFVRAGYDPYHQTLSKAFSVTDSTVTDSNGVYRTNNLDSGTYNVFGVGADSTLSLIDSVHITGDTQALASDTLKTSASLIGHIKLQPGDEPDKIIAIAMGSNAFSLISTAAQFSFANLAEGHYAVKFFSTLDNYSNYDTTFTIVAGTNVSMPDSIVMPLKIPIPTGFIIKYDTLKQIVTLSWNRMNPAKVKGYNVYRQHIGSTDSLLTPVGITDTSYMDSAGSQNETYIYRIGSISLSNETGLKTTGDSIAIESAYYVSNTLFTAGGKINAINIDKHGIYVVVRFITANSNPAKIERYSSVGTFLNSWDIPAGIEHSYTFNNVVIDDSNFIYAINSANQVIKFDDTGAVLSQFQFPGTARGLSIFNDTLYVGDFVSHKIFVYSTRGDFLFNWGGQGFQDGKFENIALIKCDSTGAVYVGDSFDYGRVQVFERNGTFRSSFDFRQFAIMRGGVDLAGIQLDIRSNLILVTGQGDDLYGFNTDGQFIFRDSGLTGLRQAFFSNDGNIAAATWDGPVLILSRK
jgi:hypothetical protein